MYATSSVPQFVDDHSVASVSGTSSVASRVNREVHSSPAMEVNDSVDAARMNSTSASFTIDRRRSCLRANRRDEQAGTATAPAYKQPKKFATNSKPGGLGSSTCLPLAPRAVRRLPMALALRSSCAKVQEAPSRSPLSRNRKTRLCGVSSARRRSTSTIVSALTVTSFGCDCFLIIHRQYLPELLQQRLNEKLEHAPGALKQSISE